MEKYQVGSLHREYKALTLVANGLLAIIHNHQACNTLTMARMAQQAREAARKLASLIERLIYAKKKVESDYPKNVVKFEDLKNKATKAENEIYYPGLFEKMLLLILYVNIRYFILQTYIVEVYSVYVKRKNASKISRVVRYSTIGYLYYRSA